jgi:hypothetical protein
MSLSIHACREGQEILQRTEVSGHPSFLIQLKMSQSESASHGLPVLGSQLESLQKKTLHPIKLREVSKPMRRLNAWTLQPWS